MLKIALVNPGKTKEHISSAAPPLNLAVLAAFLRARLKNAVEIKIIDGLAGQKVEHDLAAFQPGLVGLTSTTPTIGEAYRLADWAKNNLTGALIVMGGVHASVLPEEALPHVDAVIVGEGELALLEIANRALANQPLTEKIISRPFIVNLDEVPSPAWDLIDLEFYIAADDNTSKTIPYSTVGRRAITLISSRGCPYRCIFCHNSWRPTPVRYHSAERVVAEIEYLNSRYGLNSFFFADDEFLVNKERLEKICRSLVAGGLAEKIIWGCQARSDVIERTGPAGLELIKQAGCKLLAIGLESGSQKVLDILEKNLKVLSHQNALDLCRRAGLKVSGSFMFGTPGEEKSDMLETLNFIVKNRDRLDLTGIGVTTPYPGTKLWQICREKKLFKGEIDYAGLCPDPRFGLADERIYCDTMSKAEFRELFKHIQDQVREINFSRAVAADRYSFKKIINLFFAHPWYVFSFVFKYPKKSLSLLNGLIKKIF